MRPTGTDICRPTWSPSDPQGLRRRVVRPTLHLLQLRPPIPLLRIPLLRIVHLRIRRPLILSLDLPPTHRLRFVLLPTPLLRIPLLHFVLLRFVHPLILRLPIPHLPILRQLIYRRRILLPQTLLLLQIANVALTPTLVGLGLNVKTASAVRSGAGVDPRLHTAANAANQIVGLRRASWW